MPALLAFPDGRLYRFAGDTVWCRRLGDDDGHPGTARPIATEFPGAFTRDIDAALLNPDGTVTFFRGNQHLRYHLGARRPLPGYPRPYEPEWPGLPPHRIDAVLPWSPDVVYVFTGKTYASFSPHRGTIRRGFPKPIEPNWPGVGAGPVQTAVALPDDRRVIIAGGRVHLLDRDGNPVPAAEVARLALLFAEEAEVLASPVSYQAPPKPAPPPPSPPAPPPPAVRALPLGVDIAAERTNLAGFQNLKRRGKTFAIVKASQGRSPNGRFNDYYGFAAQAGLIRGSYHFLSNRHSRHPVFGGSIADQTAALLRLVPRIVPGDLAPALDVEDGGAFPLDTAHAPVDPHDPVGYRYRPNYVKGQAQNPDWQRGRDELLDDIQRFVDVIEAALGRTPLIYTSRTWTDSDAMQNPTRMSQYPLWFLDHYCDPARILHNHGIRTIGGWGLNYEILQYAEQSADRRWCGRRPYKEPDIDVEGLDFDAYNGTIDGLRGLADLGRPAVAVDRTFLTGATRYIAQSDRDGALHLMTHTRGSWSSRVLADPNRSNPDLEGSDPVLAAQAGSVFAYYRSQRHLVEAVSQPALSPTWRTRHLEDVVAPLHDPRAIVDGTRRHVVYWGDDDDWHLLTLDGPRITNQGSVLSRAGVKTGARQGQSTGQPVLYLAGRTCHVLGRAGFDGHLVDLWYDGQWRHDDLTANARALNAATPAATYSPCVYETPAGVTVVFRGVRGELWSIDRRTGRPTHITHELRAQAPPLLAGHPTCFVLAGVAHIVYRGVDKLIYDVQSKAGAWTARRICDDKAAADPVATTDGSIGTAAIRTMDGSIHEAVFDGTTWTCTATATATVRGAGETGELLRHADADERDPLSSQEQFGGSEHRAIGDAGANNATTALPYGQKGAFLTFGEVVALAGDYFESYTDLSELTRTPAGREQLAWARWDCLELPNSDEPRVDDSVKKKVRDAYYLLASQNVPHFGGGGTAVQSYMKWHSAAMVNAMEAGRHADDRSWKVAIAKEAFGDHFLTDMFSAGHVRTPRAAMREWYGQHMPNSAEQFVRYMAQYMYDRLDAKHQIPAFVQFLTWFTGLGPGRIASRIRLLGGEAIHTFSLGDVVSLGLHDLDNHGLMVVSRVDELGHRPADGYHWRAVGDNHLKSATHPTRTRVIPRGWSHAQLDEAVLKTERMAIAAVAASLRDLERIRNASRGVTPPSGPDTVAFLKKTLGGTLFGALDYVPREDLAAQNIPLVVTSGQSPLEWRWGQLGNEASRAVDIAVRERIAGTLASMITQIDEPTRIKQWGIEITIHGTRSAFARFVQHLATDGITAVEQAVGKRAR
jgi:GH25 family lysozyme M1 (1,4-beta-N-acetylmuramidase)